MKIIDLLNKIANGEEVPKKIKYCGVYYYWTGCNYENSEADDVLFWAYIYSEKHLNDEIEIIEEKEMCHKCGKYPAEYNQTYCEFCLGISEEDKKIEKLLMIDGTANILLTANQTRRKINEIIDKLNKEE